MFPPFLCHLPFRLSASLYIFFGKAKSTNYFTDSSKIPSVGVLFNSTEKSPGETGANILFEVTFQLH